jgi:transposase
MAVSMIRNIAPTPIKLMKARWEKLFTSKEMDLSPNSVSAMLKSIGSDYDAQRRFFASMIMGSKYLIFDMSSIFSRSENIRMADKEYNKNRLQTRQIGMVMFFSHEKRMPVILKPVTGSLRDPKTFLTAAKEYSIKRCVVIADRVPPPERSSR